MKGLLLKDFYNMKGNFKLLVILFVFYVGISVKSKDLTMLITMMGILSLILTMNNYAYDEKANWEKVALTMPLSREELVYSKYLFAGIILGVALLFDLFAFAWADGSRMHEGVMYGILLTSVYGIITGVVLPLLFKFGSQNAKYIVLILIAIPSLGISVMPKEWMPNIRISDSQIVVVAIVAAVVTWIISICISKRICSQKEYS